MAYSRRNFISQSWLIELMQNQGYQVSFDGVCIAISSLWMQAVLLGDVTEFDNRIVLLHDEDNILEKINAAEVKRLNLIKSAKEKNILIDEELKKLSSKELNLLSIKPFFDNIQIIQNAELHPELFASNSAIPATEINSSLTESKNLEKVGGMVAIGNFSSLCTKIELENYLTGYRKLLEEQNIEEPIGIMIQNQTHAISITYDAINKQWLFLDPSLLPTHVFKSDAEIADFVFKAFTKYVHEENPLDLIKMLGKKLNVVKETTISMGIDLYTTGNNKNKMKEFISTWKKSASFQKFHEVTSAKALNPDTDRGTYWLYKAVQHDDEERAVELISKLMENKMSLDLKSDNNLYPLYIAVSHGKAKMVELLLKFGAQPNLFFNSSTDKILDTQVDYPLCTASSLSNAKIVKLLLDYGADPNVESILSRKSPLYIACENGNEDIVKLLLANQRMSLNFDYTYAPLLAACKNGNEMIVKALLDKGISPNIGSKKNTISPLFLACIGNKKDIVKMLINHPDIDPLRFCYSSSKLLLEAAKNDTERKAMKSFIASKIKEGHLENAIPITALQAADILGRSEIKILIENYLDNKKSSAPQSKSAFLANSLFSEQNNSSKDIKQPYPKPEKK